MKDPEWVYPARAKKHAFTRHIVYSHPIFEREVSFSMPVSKGREESLKKLFALADLQHMSLSPALSLSIYLCVCVCVRACVRACVCV